MAASTFGDLPRWARDLVERSPVGHLSYLDERDRPRVLPVTYAVSGEAMWTAIDRKPKQAPPERIARVRYLRRRPEAALCVDHYEDDWSRLAWVQAIGSVEVFEPGSPGDEERSALALLAHKYPAYASDAPDGPLIAVRPDRLLCWRATA
jgi:PPOX class probable F420-dependent enzyme